jgi:hypothetical protein
MPDIPFRSHRRQSGVKILSALMIGNERAHLVLKVLIHIE